MKNETDLTKAQKEIYDSVVTEKWFTVDNLSYRFHNRDSQCRKIADKGYFEYRVVFDPAHPGDLTRLIPFFKKIKKPGGEK
ncbi:MAG: hypothetical protein LBT95_02115 [Treponema sp.]|jgi:hypothetical protein|nr:hypothetical protein [Treponema sp.]